MGKYVMAHTPLSHLYMSFLSFVNQITALLKTVMLVVVVFQCTFKQNFNSKNMCRIQKSSKLYVWPFSLPVVHLLVVFTVCHIFRLSSYYGNLLGGSFEEASTISSQFQSGLDKCCLQPQRECIIEEVRKPVRTLKFRGEVQAQ